MSRTTLEPVTGLGNAPTAVGSWEPCLEARALDDHGLCAGCGWPPNEHGDDHGRDRETGVVTLIRVPERPILRRAS